MTGLAPSGPVPSGPVLSGANARLLFPGVQPPITHLGATLLRHVVASGLRYALYHLGQPLPEAAPVKIERLRFFLDPKKLEALLGGTAGGRLVLAALLDPGGAGERPRGRLRGMCWFHRVRLRNRRPSATVTEGSGREGADRVTDLLRAVAPGLREAFLVEVLEALRRRARRGEGEALPPVVSPAVRALQRGDGQDLAGLGTPDPYTDSWAGGGGVPPDVDLPEASQGGSKSRRGIFRESYRVALDRLGPAIREFGRSAVEHGVVGHPEDVFFVPFDLLSSLDGDARPAWVDGAVLRNRAEYFRIVQSAEAAEERAWAASPLTPMP